MMCVSVCACACGMWICIVYVSFVWINNYSVIEKFYRMHSRSYLAYHMHTLTCNPAVSAVVIEY